MGSVYARLGAKVSIVEFADRLIPGFDGTMSKDLTRVMKKLGAEVFTETRVTFSDQGFQHLPLESGIY